MKLTDADKQRIDKQHARAIKLMLTAESRALKLTRADIAAVSDELALAATSAGKDPESMRRRMLLSMAALTAALQASAARTGRDVRANARELARVQVAGEIAQVARFVDDPLPNVLAGADTAELDAVQGDAMGRSITQRWGAAALATVTLWRRKEESPIQLIQRIHGLPAMIDGTARTNAIVQSADAYSDEHRAAMRATLLSGHVPSLTPASTTARALFDVRPLVPSPRGPSDDPFGTGPELGMPYGWGAGLFDVWSAILDRSTCPGCMRLDGEMVPVGQAFTAAFRPPLHLRCRCLPVTIFVPSAMERRLPGIQLDYAALKEDVSEYFRGSSLTGVRHIESYVQGAFAKSSPEELARRMRNRRNEYRARSN